jgi:hypothetical protein
VNPKPSNRTLVSRPNPANGTPMKIQIVAKNIDVTTDKKLINSPK